MRWIVLAFVLVANPLFAQGQAPNRLEVVRFVSDEDPARFACAHSGRPCQADWIKAVAAALHAEDARWGLNGKRGNANDLSLDVVTFRIGPTDRHVQAFDICGACGGSNPSAVWNDITNWKTIGQPGTAIWVKPAGTVVTPPVDPIDPPDTPPAVDLAPVLAALATLTEKVDAIAALALAARDAALDAKAEAEQAKVNASDIKHVSLPALLEELKATAHPCYRGRVSGWAGGSVELCPAP